MEHKQSRLQKFPVLLTQQRNRLVHMNTEMPAGTIELNYEACGPHALIDLGTGLTIVIAEEMSGKRRAFVMNRHQLAAFAESLKKARAKHVQDQDVIAQLEKEFGS